MLDTAYAVDVWELSSIFVLDRCDIFHGEHKSDAGVGLGRRHRFLDSYGFRFYTTL